MKVSRLVEIAIITMFVLLAAQVYHSSDDVSKSECSVKFLEGGRQVHRTQELYSSQFGGRYAVSDAMFHNGLAAFGHSLPSGVTYHVHSEGDNHYEVEFYCGDWSCKVSNDDGGQCS